MKPNILEKPKYIWLISLLIVYSIVCFSLQTIPEIGEEYATFFFYSEIIVVAIFTVEYLYRLYMAEKRLSYIFSFYALVDLVAILPFYMSFAVDLTNLRAIRLLRLIRIFKLLRYTAALIRFKKAMSDAKEELFIFCAASCVIIYISAVGIYYFEHPVQPDAFASIFDCLWWAVITLTTVGYGDIYPITIAGRIFTFIILLVGLGLIAVPTGIITSALSAVRREQERDELVYEQNSKNR